MVCSSLNTQNSTLNIVFKTNPAAPNIAAKAAATKHLNLALTHKMGFSVDSVDSVANGFFSFIFTLEQQENTN